MHILYVSMMLWSIPQMWTSLPAVTLDRTWWSSYQQTGPSWTGGTVWTTTGSTTMSGPSLRGTQPSTWRSAFISCRLISERHSASHYACKWLSLEFQNEKPEKTNTVGSTERRNNTDTNISTVLSLQGSADSNVWICSMDRCDWSSQAPLVSNCVYVLVKSTECNIEVYQQKWEFIPSSLPLGQQQCWGVPSVCGLGGDTSKNCSSFLSQLNTLACGQFPPLSVLNMKWFQVKQQ